MHHGDRCKHFAIAPSDLLADTRTRLKRREKKTTGENQEREADYERWQTA
jgi:hypothetical protein